MISLIGRDLMHVFPWIIEIKRVGHLVISNPELEAMILEVLFPRQKLLARRSKGDRLYGLRFALFEQGQMDRTVRVLDG